MASLAPFTRFFRSKTQLRLSILHTSPRSVPHPLRYGFRISPSSNSIRSQIFRRSYSQKPPRGTQPNPTPNLGSPEPHSISARLKKLSREYGWTVIGVYLALTVADLPLCFLAVKYIGAERIAHAEHVVVGGAKELVGRIFPTLFSKDNEEEAKNEVAQAEKEEAAGKPTFWTKLGLVFIVHKSFIFIRVPLTAAITPKVVKTLRSWGYNIGKRKPKPN